MRFAVLLQNGLRALCLCLGLAAMPAQSQVLQVPSDPSATDIDETALGVGMIKHKPPLAPGQYSPLWGSDMDLAAEHDARWGIGATSHAVGAASRVAGYLAKGNTFFVKTGDTFGKILGAYQEVAKFAELYQVMQNAWRFLQNYQLTLNLFRCLPVINVLAPDEMGGGLAYAVGLFPKDSAGWEARANLLNDNLFKPVGTGFKIVEIRMPSSMNDLVVDSNIWGMDSVDEETFQKMLLAGMYEGVVSSGLWLSNAGVGNNLLENVAGMGPRAFARRITAIILKRTTDLQARKAYLYQISTGQVDLPRGMTPELVLNQMKAIDRELEDLATKDTTGYVASQMKQQAWMRQADFVGEILTKLEHPKRRLALMKLRERYRKYEKFWSGSVEKDDKGQPSMMNPTPEITGDEKIDKAINLIWSSLTLLSKGSIPPPTPVSGGPAAESQAIMVRSAYREFLVDELRAVRRLLAFRYAQEKQKEGSERDVQSGKDEVNHMLTILDARADHIKRLREYAATRDTVYKAGEGWAFSLPGI